MSLNVDVRKSNNTNSQASSSIDLQFASISKCFIESTQEALDRVYEIVEKNPSLLHEKDEESVSLLLRILTLGQGFYGSAREKGYLNLAIKLIELDPTVDVNYCSESKLFYNISILDDVWLWFEPSNERAKLVKYLIFLGAEIPVHITKEKSMNVYFLKCAIENKIKHSGVEGAFPGLLKSGNRAFIDQKAQEFLRG